MEASVIYHQTAAEINSEELLIKAAKEDSRKFEILYSKYYEKVLKFVYQRINSKDEAYDITSQVFLKAMLHLNRYVFKGLPFSAWLYRIAINELNQLFRKNKTQRAINMEMEDVHSLIAEMKEENNEAKINTMINSLTELDEDELQIIEMRFFEKRAFKEIGEILGITENNAKVKTYRILEKLKKVITLKS